MSTSMAENKNKPKIDLRARLGKKTVGGGNPSIPPPMATGQSIPAPPFASKPPSQMQSERPRMAEPQAIKIEMSEEIIQAQKKGRTKVIMVAAATAIVGGILGVALGGGMERSGRQQIALEGAKSLAEEIDKSNVQIEKLSEVLKNAKSTLSDGQFPEKSLQELSEINIPFNGTYLYGKGTGLMSPQINQQLVDFAGKAGQANDQKDMLQRVLTAGQSSIKEMLAQQEKPKFNWSVYLTSGPHGPMAHMQPVPEPFLVTSKEKKDGKDYSWPEEIEVPDGDKKVKLKLYKEGNPVASTPLIVPVDPGSQGAVCPNDTLIRLAQEIGKLEELLKGDKSDPTNEKLGLVDLGQNLIDDLKGIGG